MMSQMKMMMTPLMMSHQILFLSLSELFRHIFCAPQIWTFFFQLSFFWEWTIYVGSYSFLHFFLDFCISCDYSYYHVQSIASYAALHPTSISSSSLHQPSSASTSPSISPFLFISLFIVLFIFPFLVISIYLFFIFRSSLFLFWIFRFLFLASISIFTFIWLFLSLISTSYHYDHCDHDDDHVLHILCLFLYLFDVFHVFSSYQLILRIIFSIFFFSYHFIQNDLYFFDSQMVIAPILMKTFFSFIFFQRYHSTLALYFCCLFNHAFSLLIFHDLYISSLTDLPFYSLRQIIFPIPVSLFVLPSSISSSPTLLGLTVEPVPILSSSAFSLRSLRDSLRPLSFLQSIYLGRWLCNN